MEEKIKINYDEVLDTWAEKIYVKTDKYDKKREIETTGTYNDGYLKGASEGYLISIAMLNLEERKEKRRLRLKKENNAQIDYDEVLDTWAEKIYVKTDKYDTARESEPAGTYNDGYLKGLSESYLLSVAMLNLEERKERRRLRSEMECNEQSE